MRRGKVLALIAALVAAWALPVFSPMKVVQEHLYLAFKVRDTTLPWPPFWEWNAHDHENSALSLALSNIGGILSIGYGVALVAATVAVVFGAVMRAIARARVRSSRPDPLDRVRTLAKPRVVRWALISAPALLWAATMSSWVHHRWSDFVWLSPMLLVVLGHVLLAREGLAAFLAPTFPQTEVGAADGFEFDAVAITRETRGALFGMIGLALAAVISASLCTHNDSSLGTITAAYSVLATIAVAIFQRASRIAVGIDGVHIHGTSRSRFFSFHELDAARLKGSNLHLLRGEHVVGTLQLHGKDAARGEALASRLSAAIARAHEERSQPAVSFVNHASPEDLVSVAAGGASYRRLAVSRDQLWAALEGPAVAPAARKAAAEALANSTDPAERARFRVAAERCAEPSVRARMQELLDEEDDADEAPANAYRMTV